MSVRWLSLLALSVCLSSSLSAAIFTGNGNTGFGDVLGNGSLTFTHSGDIVSGTLTKGAGDLNDSLVIYLDTTAGGFNSTSTFDDTADALRQAISGFNGTDRSGITFASGFDADFAIALDKDFGGLWSVADTGAHGFVNGLGLSPTGTATSATYDFTFNLSDLGLTPGDSIDFVATYIASSAFRSDEAIGDGINAGNPGWTDVTFTSAHTIVTAVPEPSSIAFLAGAVVMGAGRFRRRNRV